MYFAVGTGELEATGRTIGKVFPILQSADFYHWHSAGSALLRPDESLGADFWAPEVALSGGSFYLYYSVGHGDQNHQLRVAVSDVAQGPYRDCGPSLLPPQNRLFAIDPHPFRDDDGQWYLFYARDFLDCSDQVRAGTALMVTRMRSMTELEGEGRVVLRARSDWQRFQANRIMYGRAWDWHTLEGPFVVKRRGRYFCFYSGGRWETDSYGVDFGVADHVLGPYSDVGNESGPRVLRTVPSHVLGPGHNSIVVGPEGEDYIVYHGWDREMKARRMFIDKLVWAENGPRCEGPTWGDNLKLTP
jgi:beta-xylosidase